MKKTLCVTLCVLLMASAMLLPASAGAGNTNTFVVRPAQYTSEGPNSGSSHVIYSESFDSGSSAKALGYFPDYYETYVGEGEAKDTFVTDAVQVSVSSKHAKSGGSSLLVSGRENIYQLNKAGKFKHKNDAGEMSFTLTDHYYTLKTGGRTVDSIYCGNDGVAWKAHEITADYDTCGVNLYKLFSGLSKSGNTKKDASVFFQMWVYSETDQWFLPKLVYKSGKENAELWIPADDYWFVPANTWTLVGGYFENGKTYYSAMAGEGGKEAYGMYAPQAMTDAVTFRIATKNKQAVFTYGDYWVDDLAFWTVSDTSKMYDMQYTMKDGKVFTGLDDIVTMENKDDIASKKLVNAFAAPTTKKTAKPTKKPTTSVKVVKETNKAGEVIGTKKVVVTEASGTATGTGTGTGTGTATGTGTGTGTATEATISSVETTVTNAAGEPVVVDPEEKGSLLWLWILLGVIVVGGGAAAGIVLGKKKGAPAEEAPAEEAPAEETPSDDAE